MSMCCGWPLLLSPLASSVTLVPHLTSPLQYKSPSNTHRMIRLQCHTCIPDYKKKVLTLTADPSLLYRQSWRVANMILRLCVSSGTLRNSKMYIIKATSSFWLFVNFHPSSEQMARVLFRGQWSQEGCYLNQQQSNSSSSICECNHLTHFAILISGRSLDLPPEYALVLRSIDYVAISISLVAMATTVLCTLIFLR